MCDCFTGKKMFDKILSTKKEILKSILLKLNSETLTVTPLTPQSSQALSECLRCLVIHETGEFRIL